MANKVVPLVEKYETAECDRVACEERDNSRGDLGRWEEDAVHMRRIREADLAVSCYNERTVRRAASYFSMREITPEGAVAWEIHKCEAAAACVRNWLMMPLMLDVIFLLFVGWFARGDLIHPSYGETSYYDVFNEVLAILVLASLFLWPSLVPPVGVAEYVRFWHESRRHALEESVTARYVRLCEASVEMYG